FTPPLLLFLPPNRPHLDLHSFPTRRSSDLRTRHQRFTILSLFPAGPAHLGVSGGAVGQQHAGRGQGSDLGDELVFQGCGIHVEQDRKSTRLNSSHVSISYAVFCLKKKNETS